MFRISTEKPCLWCKYIIQPGVRADNLKYQYHKGFEYLITSTKTNMRKSELYITTGIQLTQRSRNDLEDKTSRLGAKPSDSSRWEFELIITSL